MKTYERDALTKLSLGDVILSLNQAKSALHHISLPGAGHAKNLAFAKINDAIEDVQGLMRGVTVGI
jgi:hypothetical protein